MKYVYSILKSLLFGAFGGSVVLAAKVLIGIESSPLDLFCLYFGAFCGSFAVDVFRWWRRRERTPALKDDVIEIIDKIYERNIEYADHTPEERGYINAKRWSIPLSQEQLNQMNKVLYVKNN